MAAFLWGGWRDLFRDLFAVLDAIVVSRLEAAQGRGMIRAVRALLLTGLALCVTWWIYVPVHELLHAAGCLATGGSVTRLALSPVYGAAWIARVVPFVEPASEGYAGRLTGFDTGGSDLRFLATDAAPYLLTVLIGMPLLGRLARRRGPGGPRAWIAGPAMLIAAAPLLGLTGDYFEMGSILITAGLDPRHEALRSDDMFRLVRGMIAQGSPAGAAGWVVVAASFVLGALLAGWTLRLGAWLSPIIFPDQGASASPPRRAS